MVAAAAFNDQRRRNLSDAKMLAGDTSTSALVSASFQNQLVKLLRRDGLV
jgi:hypothetical protein